MTHYMKFSADNIRCALPLAGTRIVLRIVRMMPPAEKRHGLAGTISFHGETVPVYSLRSLLSLPYREPHLRDMLIIVHSGTGFLGLWVDEIAGVFDSPAPVPAGAAKPATPGFPGIYADNDGTLVIQDLSGFLADAGMAKVPAALIAGARKGGGAGAALEETMPEREIQAVLEHRAQALARPKEESKKAQIVDVLFFRLVYKEYAMEMKYIREVVLSSEITPVPGTPDYISGICAVRGEIISLVDPRIFFNIPERGLTDLNRVIIITDGRTTFGMLADYITGLGTIPLDDLKPVGPGLTSINSRYLQGITSESLILLDAAALLSDEKMIVDDSA